MPEYDRRTTYPVRVKLRRDQVFDTHWIATAVVEVRDSRSNEPIVIPGFGCALDMNAARNAAYFECLEHVLGSAHPYSDGELNEFLSVASVDRATFVSEVRRRDLLVSRDSIGLFRNSTGLAIADTKERALQHAFAELLERHIAYKWWFNGSVLLEITKHSKCGSSEIWLLSTKVGDWFFVAAVQISYDPAQFLIGMCCARSLARAEAHAEAELVMLSDAAATVRATPQSERSRRQKRYEVLIENASVSRMDRHFKLLGRPSTCKLAPAVPEARVNYATIQEKPDLFLVRTFSPEYRDATISDGGGIDSPFL